MEDFRLSFSTGDGSGTALSVGLLIIALGGFWLWRRWRFVRASASSFGTVIDYEVQDSRDVEDRDDDDQSGITYAPIVSYTGPDGSSQTFTERMSLYKKRYAVGTVVRIRYTPHNNEASIDSFLSLYLGPLIVIIFGLIFVVVEFLPFSPALD